jgi:hypothetical protein
MWERTMPRRKSPIKARLEEWDLKSVPFPAVPFVDFFNEDPRRNGTVFAPELRADAIERIRHEVLKEGFPTAISKWNWIWARKHLGGNLGMGKTALLTYVVDQINRDFGSKFFNFAAHWLAIYVLIPPKTKSLDDVMVFALASICSDARGISIERQLLARLRRRIIVLNHSSQYPAQLNNAQENKFSQDRWLVEAGVNLDTLAGDVEKLLRENDVRQRVAHVVATGNLGNYLAELNGDANLMQPKHTLSSRASGILLTDMARIAQAAGIQQVTLFLDNFYYLVRATPPAERPTLAARIRDMAVDGAHASVRRNRYSWVAVMHTQTNHTFNSAWESCDMDTIAPLNMNAPNSILLGALPLAQGRALLEAYLSFQRPRAAPSQWHPFDAAALDAIVKVSAEQGNARAGTCEPRSLLQAAWEVTWRALADGAER